MIEKDRDELEIIRGIELQVEALRTQIQQQIIPDYRPLLARIEAVQSDYIIAIQKLGNQVTKSSSSQSLDRVGMALNNLSGEVQVLRRLLQQQDSLIRRWISWKAFVIGLLSMTLVTGALVFLGLRIVTPQKDQLLDAKLEIIYQQIEEVRKQTSP